MSDRWTGDPWGYMGGFNPPVWEHSVETRSITTLESDILSSTAESCSKRHTGTAIPTTTEQQSGDALSKRPTHVHPLRRAWPRHVHPVSCRPGVWWETNWGIPAERDSRRDASVHMDPTCFTPSIENRSHPYRCSRPEHPSNRRHSPRDPSPSASQPEVLLDDDEFGVQHGEDHPDRDHVDECLPREQRDEPVGGGAEGGKRRFQKHRPPHVDVSTPIRHSPGRPRAGRVVAIAESPSPSRVVTVPCIGVSIPCKRPEHAS